MPSIARSYLRSARHTILATPIGPVWLQEVARDVTSLGGATILTLRTVAVLGFLLLGRRYAAAFLVAVSISGGSLLNVGLKAGFDSSATRSDPARGRGVLRELSKRARDARDDHVSHARSAASSGAVQTARQGVPAELGTAAQSFGRHKPHLPRRSLADGRAGRMVCRIRVGASLWHVGSMASTKGRGRISVNERSHILATR